jgi:hypothetical protein
VTRICSAALERQLRPALTCVPGAERPGPEQVPKSDDPPGATRIGPSLDQDSGDVDESRAEAEFPNGITVQVRRSGVGRWELWVSHGASRQRQKSPATPFFDHARRIAEHWYGQPKSGWYVPEASDV